MTELKTGIGADTNLYTKSDYARVKRTLAFFEKYTREFPPKEPWLDVGAGESVMLDHLRAEKSRAIETSNIDLDISRYLHKDNHFLTITSFELIEHLFNPLFHMEEIKRVLSPEGNLFLTTPNDQSLIYKAEHLLNRKYRPHFHQFSAQDLDDICKRAGLEVVTIKKFFRSASGTLARISRNGLFLHARKGK
jgi:SAM-dependent methyltransferase